MYRSFLNELILSSLENAVHNGLSYFFIPNTQSEAAQLIAREIFLEYISKYNAYGLTEDNIVNWSADVPHQHKLPDMPPPGEVYLHSDGVGHWSLELNVPLNSNELCGYFTPSYIIAYHELMHAEEYPYVSDKGLEILASTKSIILQDEVYKKVNNIEINKTVDYKRDIWVSILPLQTIEIPIGSFANFYRNLEKEKGSLAKAIASVESLKFLASTYWEDIVTYCQENAKKMNSEKSQTEHPSVHNFFKNNKNNLPEQRLGEEDAGYQRTLEIYSEF